MKKLLFLLLFTIFFANSKALTSIYHPFPDSNAVWNFYTSVVMCNFGGSVDSYYSISISGDTVIKSKIYHKLSTPFVQSIITGTCSAYINKGYQGAIRQDTSNRKIFYVPPSDSIEQLLYDFNMQVGDTVKGFLESFASPSDTVYSIDSVLVGSDYRKRWNINPCYNIRLIEGIGSAFGLIQLSPGCITDAPGFTLTCFSQNDTTLYPDTATSCELITDVRNVYSKKYLTTISPNPFNDKLNIGTTENEPSEIILFDLTSRKILQRKFTHSISLNAFYLAGGLYFYEVRNENGTVAKGKVVKE